MGAPCPVQPPHSVCLLQGGGRRAGRRPREGAGAQGEAAGGAADSEDGEDGPDKEEEGAERHRGS